MPVTLQEIDRAQWETDSQVAQDLARIYREEHLSFDELFDRSFVLDRTSKLSAADVFSSVPRPQGES